MAANRTESTIRDIEDIFGTGIFSAKNAGHPLFRAAFVQLLILIRDLMAKCSNLDRRIEFSDDIMRTENISDVTDLIKFVRDAICHLESPNHKLDKNKNIIFSFNVAIGKCNLAKIDDVEIKSIYEDDICVFFGAQGIYIKRHLLRAFEEAKVVLIPEILKAQAVASVRP